MTAPSVRGWPPVAPDARDNAVTAATDVVDLDDPGSPAPGVAGPWPLAARWRLLRPAERRLTVAVAALLLAGVGSARQLGLPPVLPVLPVASADAAEPATAPAESAAPSPTPTFSAPAAVPLPGVAAVTGTGTRLLLVGTGATAYEVDAARADRVLTGSGLSPVLDAAGLRGGDIVVSGARRGPRVPGQVTLSLPDGSAPRQIGVGTRLVASRRPDAVWVVTVRPGQGAEQVRLVTVAGTIAAGPFLLPDDGDLVGELPDGLVVRAGDAAGSRPLELVDTHGRRVRRLAGDSADASVGGDHLAVLAASGALTVDGSPRTAGPGSRAVFASGAGDLAAEGTTGLTVLRTGQAPLLLPSPANGCPPVWGPTGWLFVTSGAGVAALAPRGTRLQTLPASFADVPLCVGAAGVAASPARTGDPGRYGNGDTSQSGDGSDGDGRPGAKEAWRTPD